MPFATAFDLTIVIALMMIMLVPLAAAGLALINTGLGRSHAAAHVMLSSLCVFAIAGGVFFICGFAWQGYITLPAHSLNIGGKAWNVIGAQPFFFRHFPLATSPASLAALLSMFSVGLAALIPLGAGIDRWRLSAACSSTAILAAGTYPVFAHWAWSGGWLAQLGANYGLGRGFQDAGGSGAIQLVGGLTALSIAWLLGPRAGKYSHDGMPAAIPGHNVVLVLLGCTLAFVGWLGLNSAGAMLFMGSEPNQIVRICMNTFLAAGSAGLTAVVITGVRFGRPDVSISANGWVGGLAASSAACAFIEPASAIVLGLIAGVLVTFSVEWFEARFFVDDPGGAVSVHAIGGLWGLLALGIFEAFAGNTRQLIAQLIGIGTLLGFVLPLTYGLNLVLGLLVPHRVNPEGERQGLDLYELGAGAYPEFVTHTDEFTQR